MIQIERVVQIQIQIQKIVSRIIRFSGVYFVNNHKIYVLKQTADAQKNDS